MFMLRQVLVILLIAHDLHTLHICLSITCYSDMSFMLYITLFGHTCTRNFY